MLQTTTALNRAFHLLDRSANSADVKEGLMERPTEAESERLSSALVCTYPKVVRYQLPTPFYGRLQDGDQAGIMDYSRIVPAEAGLVKIRLEAGPNITWWKQIDILDCRGNLLARDYTQDSKRTTIWFIFRAEDIQGASVLLWKAKMFGIHTPMYQMQNLERASGAVWNVYWGLDA